MTVRTAVPILLGWRGGAVGLFVAHLAAAPAVCAQGFDAEFLQSRVEAYRTGSPSTAAGQPLQAAQTVASFYAARAFEPAWLSPTGRWAPLADGALALIETAHRHGLDPGDYHRGALVDLQARIHAGRASPYDRADAELLLSDAVLHFGSHLLRGRTDPARLAPEWAAHRRSAALEALLASALEGGRLGAFVEAVAPRHPEYTRLVDALQRLRDVAAGGGWPFVGEGPSLRPDS